MARPARARINLAAFRHNLQLAIKWAGNAQVAAVIKADGYGHGIVAVARAAEQDGCMLAVASIEEAARVRAAGIVAPILLLEGFFHASEPDESGFDGLQWVIHSEHQLAALEERDSGLDVVRPLSVWLKFNTGMNRLGLPVLQAESFVSRVCRLASVRLEGVMTHFACADEPENDFSGLQMARFDSVLSTLDQVALPQGLKRSLCNSAGLQQMPAARGDLVRPGIMLYGASPFFARTAVQQGLHAVMSLESELIAVNELAEADCVGYGLTWCASRVSRIGVVAMGYADGYPRHAPSGTPVWVSGKRVPLVGRVSMDMLTVDLTDHEVASVGDHVELWGANVSVDEVARSAG
ncbi:MAG: alanine racemase, partial [Anaerolineae bacterium]|nr:alanine racemase [Anaerolineae bacterium]